MGVVPEPLPLVVPPVLPVEGGEVVGGRFGEDFLTIREGLLVTAVAPPAFLAVTTTRSLWPTSWLPSRYVSQLTRRCERLARAL